MLPAPIADAYVRFGLNIDTNYGSDANLVSRSSDEWSRESYLKFELSGISNVTSVALRLYTTVNAT